MPGIADHIPRSVAVTRTARVAATADKVWSVVGDIGSLVPGGGMVKRVDVVGAGEGAIRTFHLLGGAQIVERIETHDPTLRRYVYRIIDVGPLDCARYLGAAEVTPAGSDACILSWSAMADPVGVPPTDFRAGLEANLDGAIRAVAVHCEARAT